MAIAISLTVCQCVTPSILATQSIQLGDQLNNENRYEESARHYEEYLRYSKTLGTFRNSQKEAEVHRKLAHAYSAQGLYKKAADNLHSALLLDSLGNLDTVEDHQLIGNLFALQGNYRKAKAHLNYCLEKMLKVESSLKAINQEKLAKTLLLEAQVDMVVGNLREATRQAQQANARYFKLQDDQGCAEAELILAINERDRGNIESSAKHLERSLDLERKINGNLSRHLQLAGDLQFVIGDPEGAILLKTQALEEARKTGIKPMIALANKRLGEAYLKLGDQKKSDYFFKATLTLQSEFETSPVPQTLKINFTQGDASKVGRGTMLIEQAEVKAHYKKYDSAILLARQAKDFFNLAENKEGQIRVCLDLVEYYLQIRQLTKAKESLRDAEHATTMQNRWKVLYFKGRVLEFESKLDSAIDSYKKSEAEIRRLRSSINLGEFRSLFANEKFEIYDHLIVLLVKKGLAENDSLLLKEAFIYNEQARARTFFETLGNNSVGTRTLSDSSMIQYEQDLRSKINRLHQSVDQASYSSPEGYQQLTKDLEQAQIEYDILTQRIKLDNKKFYSLIDTSVPDIQALQQSVSNDAKVVEFWFSDLDCVIVWVIDKEEITTKLVNGNTAQLIRKLRGVRSSIALKDAQLSVDLLKELYDLLFRPIQFKLQNSKQLVIVPHRQLHFIPFQALMNGNVYLVENFVISLSPSLSVLSHHTQLIDTVDESFLGMALAGLKIGGLSPLPGTENEIKALQHLYKDGQFKTDQDFTETFFKSNASRFGLIHFATHGIFNPDYPLYSYLAMNSSVSDDGRLTVKEVFDLSLKSRSVVLSACETGMGGLSNADELVGLSRAFLYAGAHRIVVSLWKVDDTVTSWLLVRFYGYLKNGLSYAEALTMSQRDLLQGKLHEISRKKQSYAFTNDDLSEEIQKISDEQLRLPYYWAPFVLIGSSD